MASAVCAGVLMAAAAVWFVNRISQTLWLFAAGLLIAFVLDPLLDKLEARGWSRAKAVALVAGCAVVLVALALSWIIPALVAQAQSLAQHWSGYSEAIDQAYANLESAVRAYAQELFPEYDAAPYLDAKVEEGQAWLEARLPAFLRMVTDRLVRSVSFTGTLILLAIITVHFMMVIDPFRAAIRDMLPQAASDDVEDISRKVGLMLGQYLRGQASMILVAGCVATVFMVGLRMFYGTEYSLVVGLVTGITYIIPWIGAAASTVLAAVLSYVSATHDPLHAAIIAAVLMTVNNQICDQLIMPRIIGRQVGLHPLAVIFAMLAGYQVMGVAGMIIAAPAVASIKIILARWLPLKEVQVRPGRVAPLLLDISAAGKMLSAGVQDLTRRVENAIGIGPEDESDGPHAPTEQKDVSDDGNQEPDDPRTS
ncbi:MAG: AI-2E family transporter [Armatimonadetes bacterium]|nr:AI-2E family transporter [Armatimonadota bacterium]